MLSVVEINQNFLCFESLNFQVKFRINNQLCSFNINSIDQVFEGENISLKRAIDQKTMLQCFIDVGEELGGDVFMVGRISLTWKPEENECYIGLLWIEPEFRGNGVATYILNEISNFADELGIVLTLHAMPFISPERKPTDEEILQFKDYFRRFGFRDNSETKGIGFGNSMERLPRIGHHYNKKRDYLTLHS